MNREERERMVDRLLDSALAAQNVEPRERLEERILANLRTQPERRPRWSWVWLPALAAAVVLVAIGLHFARRTQLPASPNVAQQQPANERRDAEPQRGTEHRVGPQAIARRDSHSRLPNRQIAKSANRQIAKAWPRQEVFPSPVPLTPEERMLLALVRRNRPEAVNVAQMQESERERLQKYFETGEAPVPLPAPQPAQPMR